MSGLLLKWLGTLDVNPPEKVPVEASFANGWVLCLVIIGQHIMIRSHYSIAHHTTACSTQHNVSMNTRAQILPGSPDVEAGLYD
jgi:hypothetical protein